jgi:hypothetical protein
MPVKKPSTPARCSWSLQGAGCYDDSDMAISETGQIIL